jgi:hypothetical protein
MGSYMFEHMHGHLHVIPDVQLFSSIPILSLLPLATISSRRLMKSKEIDKFRFAISLQSASTKNINDWIH